MPAVSRSTRSIRIQELLLDFYVDIYGFIEGTIAVGHGSVWIVTVNDRLLERFNLAVN